MTRHLFVTQDYGPDHGGMARRHVELCRRFGAREIVVSTVASRHASAFDAAEHYAIARESFPFSQAKKFTNQVRWAGSIARHLSARGGIVHLGNLRPCGYALLIARQRRDFPYVVYVNGGDLLREERKLGGPALKRWAGREILAGASGVVANSPWTADLARRVMRGLGVRRPPEVAAIDLGTDPAHFHPGRDLGRLRRRFGIGDAPLLVTVARLVPHKGQDTVLDAMAASGEQGAGVHYLLVGEGEDRERLEQRVASHGLTGRVHFAGGLPDDDVAEAYATASVYVGMSRLDNGINVEGFGISFVEASACGVPVIAGDSGGVRAAVRDGEAGVVVPPTDSAALAQALGILLANDSRRAAMGAAGRRLVESHYNWDRVARETLAFVERVTS